MNSTSKILLSLLILSFYACEEKTDVPLLESEEVIIVDATITSSTRTQTVRLSKSFATLNEASTPVSSASIKIKTEDEEYEFFESSPGIYTSEAFAAVGNREYTLTIEVNNIMDSAVATMHPVSAFKNYYFSEKENGLLKYYYTGSDLPAMTDIFYNWEDNPEYCVQYGSCYALETYYTINSIDIIEEFAPNKEEILIPQNTKVIRRKYSLSPEHQDYIRSLLSETEWRGGIFDVEHGNVPTNFNNGLKGWFGVCQVLSDSTVATSP